MPESPSIPDPPSEPAPPPEGADAPESPDVGFARTLLQFFVIPMAVVAVGVGIFVGFAWLVSDDTTAEDHLARLRSGSQREKRHAAFELANRIQHGGPGEFQALGPDLLLAFEEARSGEPWVRQYLALALGALGDPAAAEALVPALSDDDGTVQVYAAWALGSVGGPQAVSALVEASRSDDAGLRTMAVYGLGALGAGEAAPALRRAMDDPVFAVSVNAVVALARIGDPGAEARLLGLLEPDYWRQAPDLDGPRQALARLSAVQAAGALAGVSPNVRAALEAVAAEDPDLRIREVALRALAGGADEPVPLPPDRP